MYLIVNMYFDRMTRITYMVIYTYNLMKYFKWPRPSIDRFTLAIYIIRNTIYYYIRRRHNNVSKNSIEHQLIYCLRVRRTFINLKR